MRRIIYMAGVNTRPLARRAADCPYWLLSVTLVTTANAKMLSWLPDYLQDRRVLWDPGTFSANAVAYQTYRRLLPEILRPGHQYLQYDEIGDPEATSWYLRDMRRRGLNPWPILQPGGAETILRAEEVVAIGGIVPMSDTMRCAYLDRLFYSRPTAAIHLLGMGQEKWFRRYPAASGDSTTWIPRAPYNRRLTAKEWLSQYGELEIEVEADLQIRLEV